MVNETGFDVENFDMKGVSSHLITILPNGNGEKSFGFASAVKTHPKESTEELSKPDIIKKLKASVESQSLQTNINVWDG